MDSIADIAHSRDHEYSGNGITDPVVYSNHHENTRKLVDVIKNANDGIKIVVMMFDTLSQDYGTI